MTYDPFQTYSAFGPYAGINNPIGLQYAALQNSLMNPMAAVNPFATQSGINPQQLQLAAILASQGAIPQLLGLSPYAVGQQHNPLLSALHNPMAGLQNPQLNPILASMLASGPQLGYQPQQFGYQPNSPWGQVGSPYGVPGSPMGQQIGLPFGQTGQPFGQAGSPFAQQTGSPFGQTGFPLAPQSWVGQGGPFGSGPAFGQGNPLLAQLSGRPFQMPGISPWGY